MAVAPPAEGRPPHPVLRGGPRRLALTAAAVVVAAVVVAGLLLRPSPPSGWSPSKVYTFSLIAGRGGTLTFNGSSPGPPIAVPFNATVRLTVTNDPASGVGHSFLVIPKDGSASSPPVFQGASTSHPMTGLQPGTSETITFVTDQVGEFLYICGVPGHHEAGMQGNFTVTPP